MAKAGRRYTLVIYTHMLNRWWPATFALSLALFAVAWGVSRIPEGQAQPYLVTAIAGLGGLVFIFTLFLLIIRKAAYVQAFPTYLRLVTPFLRINISYRRFRGSTTSEMRALFPPKSLSSWRREIIAPLSSMTAIVINLNGYPVSPAMLRLFLSPFFFKDKTPHIVILVKDWLLLSTEIDSMRLGGRESQIVKARPRNNSILSRLPRK
ncbi:MAG: hypothetical protein JW963_14495 [Anaerolineales bacterium]|nr:hypothetical protein [Anaerolineales bacterium]